MKKEPEPIITNEPLYSETLNFSEILRSRVLGKNGLEVGKVKQIRVNPEKLIVEGILVRRSLFKKPIYIGASYFLRLSEEAVLLKINPSVLIVGKRIITSEGEDIGKVKKVERHSKKNEVKFLIMDTWLTKETKIPIDSVRSIGEKVILKSNYNAKKDYFWKRSK